MIIVDIGANDGALGQYILEKQSEFYVYSVEPNSILCGEVLSNLQNKFRGHFKYIPVAIDQESGRSKLFASNIMNSQLASLRQVNTSAPWTDAVSKHLQSSAKNEYIEVDTLSVSDFMTQEKLNLIDFLKIDSQGTDLEILEHFLANAEVKVAAVEVEISFDQKNLHYQDSQNNIERLFQIISTYNYHIYKLVPASSDCNEYNAFIAKTHDNYLRVDSILHFEKLPPFERFWAVMGMGGADTSSIMELQSQFFRKLISAFKHPLNSYRSLLLKITR